MWKERKDRSKLMIMMLSVPLIYNQRVSPFVQDAQWKSNMLFVYYIVTNDEENPGSDQIKIY